VFIDGKEVGKPSGFCSPGECTASGTWTIDGEALGAGEHKLGIRATDNADNISNEKLYTFSIRNAPPMKIGPGTVDPVTGQLGLSASDASLAGVGSVSRAYLSRYAQSFSEAAGVESPLGPQWSFSVGDGLTLNVLPSGSVELRERGGEPTTYLYSEKTYHAPKGDENLKLESKEKEAGHGITEYILTNEAAGRSTTFTLPSKSSTWVPAYSEAAESREKVQYAYRTYEVELPRHVRYLATEPTEVLAPVPAGVACGKNPSEVKLEELKAGCRAFSFTYAETTTAKGENSNEWGEYRGLLSTVSITTYNPSSTVKAMVTTPVAKYAYDQNGRLRSEWDPRISPSPLKTTYGYDNYGDISTVSGPGQQPSLIHYGTTSTDNSIARVLSIARPLASVALGNGNIPVNTKTPTLSTTSPVVGTTLSVSNGEWTNLPLNYTYHWDDCTTTNAEACTRIDGAVNQTYTPQPRDAGFRIVAYVTAENGTGAPAAASAVSNPIPLSTPKFSSTLTGALTIGEAKSVAVTPAGNLWFTDNNQRIVEESSSGALIRVVGWGVIDYAEKFEICTSSCHAGIAGSGNGQFYRPWGIAVNPTTGNIYVGDQENERIEEFNEKGEFIRAFGKYGTGHGLLSGTTGGIAIDAAGHVWIADYGNNLVQEFSETGTYMTEIGNSTGLKLTEPIGVAVSGEEVYVVEAGEARIYVYNTSGTLLTRWGKPGSGEGELEFGSLEGIAREATTGDLYVTDCTKNRIQVLNPAGKYVTKFGASGTEGGQFACPVGISFDGSNNIYVADSKNKRIQKWTPAYSTSNPVPSAPSAGSNAITTIEYGVPLYGTGAPFQMTSGELAKWGQEKDLPGQATAVFPPDEPMGWPASGYKRATVEYLDPESRLVNVATPNGGITTSEYNTDNEVTRTLSAADRATAIKEGGKSAEVAASLSSESIYAENGTQLKETIGPEHKVRLPNGEEEETRDRQEFAYNEGHPSEEAQYDLLTKKVSLAESTVGKKVLERHETATSYAGSGWKLREPTAVTSTVEGQATTKLTTYEKETGLPKEVLASVSLSAPPYALQFGASGTGNGQMKTPGGTALDSHGDLWVVDRGNNRVEEFSSLGQFITAYGSEGTGASQFKAPQGIAINQSTGNVYVTDSGNNRVEELSSEGKFVAAFGFGVGTGESKYEICTSACRAGIAGSGGGQFNNPVGVTVSASGVLWVVDRGNNRIEKFSSANGYLSTYGSSGTGEVRFKEPAYIAISGNELYVTDSGNHRVEELSETGKYVSQFGSSGSGNGQFGDPYAIAADPGTGALYVGDLTNNRVEQFSEAGLYMSQFGTSGTGNGQFKEPVGISVNAGSDVYVVDSANARVEMWEQMRAAPVFSGQFGNGDFSGPSGSAIDAHGDLWVANAYGNQIEEFSSTGVRLHVYSEWGAGAGQVKEPIGMAVNQGTGIVYVGDGQNNRVDEFNEKGEFVSAFGYGVTDGAEKLETCTSTCRAGLSGGHAGEFHEAGWVAVDTSGNIWVGDESNNRVQEFNSKSEFLRTFGFGVTNGKSEFEVCTSSCQTGIAGSGSGQLSNPTGIAVAGGHVYVGDLNNNRVEMFSTEGAYLGQFGSSGSGNGQFNQPDGVAADAAGNVYVSDIKNNRVEEFTASGAYLRTIGSKGSGNGELSEPLGVTVVGFNIYIADAGNNRVDQWGLAPSPGNEGASNSKTIYYTAATNSEYENCGKHPEWATLVCQTERTVQPGDSGPPSLPVTTYVYNIWDEPEEIVEKVVSEKLGPVTRTTKKTFDAAGRETASEETTTSSEDSSLPSVTNEYNSETGAFVKQVEILKGEEKAITLAYNTLGQLTSYTDASGATTKYAYDVDGRIEEVTEPKGRQVYSYDPTSGFLTKLLDTSAGTFTASYNSEGKMLTEGYPNGMTSTYSYDSLGRPTNLEYEKTTHCSEKCILFSDSEAYNAGGQVAYQASSLASENYTYNESGQLTKTQETPVAGEGCVTRTRLYGYSEETGERESLTSREPNEKHECMAEGGVVEGHFYDAVGRLLDPGVTYDSLGNMTKVPVADSGGLPITSAFYVDGQVVTQEQNEKAIGYTYDPAGRTMTAALKTKSGTVTTISHYAGPGNALTWTCEEAGGCKEEKEGKWSRDIPGIDGELDAIQENGGAPTLQLHDLQGDVVATAPDSETEAKLINTYTSTEFGVPVGTRPKYSWLGARGVDSELGTGVVTSGGGTYVPQAAQVLQTNQVIPPGAAPNGTLTSETYRPPAIEWLDSSAAEEASNTLAEQRMTEAQAELAADGEGEDPTFYYTRAEALQRGKKLEALTFYSEYVDLVGTVWEGLEEGVVKFLEGALTDKLDGVDKSFAWFSDTGKELVSCASEALICKISYKEWTLKSKTVTIFDPFTFKEETIWEFKLQLIDPFSPAVVQWCLGDTTTNHGGCYSNK
jgi:YD repeat-containing protein